MPLGDRDYIRGKHPPACTCKECENRRLGISDYTTNVPFGGGNKPSSRGISTQDAANKGLLEWDGNKYVVPNPDNPKMTVKPKLTLPQATLRNKSAKVLKKKDGFPVSKILVNTIAVGIILWVLYAIYWVLTQ